MEKHLPAGVECFDVGAGSGILSIAAIMMGASRVDAVEIDADSVENARENLVLNNCERHVKIVAGSIDKFEGHKYPVILINIISKVIVDLFDRGLIEYLEPDGIIIVSGVLVEEKERFLKIIRQMG